MKLKNFTFIKVKDDATGIQISFERNLGDNSHLHYFICKDKYYDAIDSFEGLEDGDKVMIKIVKTKRERAEK